MVVSCKPITEIETNHSKYGTEKKNRRRCIFLYFCPRSVKVVVARCPGSLFTQYAEHASVSCVVGRLVWRCGARWWFFCWFLIININYQLRATRHNYQLRGYDSKTKKMRVFSHRKMNPALWEIL
jgi:hypothetical protein